MKKPRVKLSPGASLGKAKYEESKHKRDLSGKYDNKPGAGDDAPSGKHSASMKEKGKTSGIKGDDVIKVHVSKNPKKAGSESAKDFDKYKNDMTVAEFKAAVGPKGMAHIAHDLKKGYISVHAPGSLPKAKIELKKEEYVAAGKLTGIKSNDVIKLHPGSKVGEMVNPKKPGSKSAQDFDKYKDEMTVDEFAAAVGDKKAALAHIAHDKNKGFVSVHSPKDLQAMRSGALKVAPPEPVKQPFKPDPLAPKPIDTLKPLAPLKPAAPTGSLSGMKSDEKLWLVTSQHSFKDGSMEAIKHKALSMSPGKALSKEGFLATKAGTPAEKEAAVQKLLEGGHVKIVKAEALEKISTLKLSSPVPIQKTKPVDWKIQDARWAKAAGADVHPKENLRSSTEGLLRLQATQAKLTDNNVVALYNGSLASYKGTGYRSINGNLRAGAAPSGTVKAIDSLMKPTKADAYMWRGYASGVYDGMPPPKDFTDLGFTSVSYNPAIAAKFAAGATIFRVRVPKGAPAIGIARSPAGGGAHGELKGEAEVVLGRGGRFRHVGTQKVGSKTVVEVEYTKADGSPW